MFDLLGEIDGSSISDMGEWSGLVDDILDRISTTHKREWQTVKNLLTVERNVYLVGEGFWIDLKEMV